MELEEMKTLWEEMSQKVEKQQLVTDQIIMDMTQQKYTSKFSKIFLYESLGTVICFAMAVYILFNIEKLDTWYLMACGIFTLAFLFLLPLFTLWSLTRIKSLDVAAFSYKETLVRFERSKKWVLLSQRTSIYLSFILFLAVLPVLSKIFNNKDMFTMDMDALPWIFTGAVFVLLILFLRWGYGCYKSITASAEMVLKELED
ncbi:MAG: hypothetical protein E2O87_03890 [Bacteroidetes bacterium]|nr:MAG: hypothetical protein E2O87_03890 [Bacteroidota bacterium]